MLQLDLAYRNDLFMVLYYSSISMINIKSNIKFFADDTMLFSTVRYPLISASDLNHDLDIKYQWNMVFNPEPSKKATEVLSSYKISNPNRPQIIFSGE